MYGILKINQDGVGEQIAKVRQLDLDRLTSGSSSSEEAKEAFDSLGHLMADYLVRQEYITPTSSNVVIGVPRGGIPIYYGLCSILEGKEYACLANVGDCQVEEQPILDLEISLDGKILIISDTIIHNGDTVIKIIDAATEFGEPCEVHAIGAISKEKGMATIEQRYANRNFNMKTYAFCVENKEEDVGGRRLLAGIPDIGEIVSFLYLQ